MDAREASVAQHVPYMRHVEEDMLKTKEGHFMMVVKVGGFCFQTADQVEIDMRLSSRNTIVRSMNDSRFAVWSHIVRREVTPEIGGDFDNFFCAELNRRYMETQVHKRMFVNDLYVTIIRRGFQGKVGMADKATNFFRKGMGVDPAELQLEAKRELRDTVGNYCKEMASYGARVLGCVMRQGVVCTEIGEFLAMLLNGGTPLSMALPRMGLDEYLPTKRITFGKKALEFRGHAKRNALWRHAVDSRISRLYGRRDVGRSAARSARNDRIAVIRTRRPRAGDVACGESRAPDCRL